MGGSFLPDIKSISLGSAHRVRAWAVRQRHGHEVTRCVRRDGDVFSVQRHLYAQVHIHHISIHHAVHWTGRSSGGGGSMHSKGQLVKSTCRAASQTPKPTSNSVPSQIPSPPSQFLRQRIRGTRGHIGAHGAAIEGEGGQSCAATVPVLLMVANVCVFLLQCSHTMDRNSSVFTGWIRFVGVSVDVVRGRGGFYGESCLKCLTLFERFSLPPEHMEAPMSL